MLLRVNGMACCKSDEPIAMANEAWVGGDHKCVSALLSKAHEDCIEFDLAARFQDEDPQAECACRLLDLLHLDFGVRIIRVHEHAVVWHWAPARAAAPSLSLPAGLPKTSRRSYCRRAD